MADIDILHSTTLAADDARVAVIAVADKLAREFDVTSQWQGDTLVFTRSGVDGRIELLPAQVRVSAKLGFPYSMMQGVIDAEIRRVLAEKLG